MNPTRHELIMQHWNLVQHKLPPDPRNDAGTPAPKLEQVIHIQGRARSWMAKLLP